MTALRLKRAPGLRPSLTVALAAVAAFLTACASSTTPAPPSAPPPQVQPRVETPSAPPPAVDEITPPHLKSDAGELVRAAILLPFSSASAGAREQAQSMLNAAQLAVFDRGHPRFVLIPKDTAGTPEGARSAARSAIRDGANVILGPLFGDGVKAAAAEARAAGLPLIAFSNDRSAAVDGAYLMGLSPDAEVERMVEYASRLGYTRFAGLAPSSTYGYRIKDSLERNAGLSAASVTAFEFYPAGASADELTGPAQRLAQQQGAYDAVFLAEGGVRLLSLAPVLPYYDVDPRIVKFMGPSLWNDASIAREPALAGGWFVAPDPAARQAFEASYERRFKTAPARLSSLSYDAVSLAAHLTRDAGAAGLTREALGDPKGFAGADGIFRFGADGVAERGLAVFEIQNGEFVVIEGAPNAFPSF